MEEKAEGLLSVLGGHDQQGGLLSNTPLANSKKSLSSGGEDTAHVSLFVAWNPTHERMFPQWDELKEAAQGSNASQYFESNGDKWLVSPSGFRQGGDAKKGPMLRWKLQWGGFTLGIQNRSEPKEGSTSGNVWLIISSETLMAVGGLKPAYDMIEEKLRVMGGTILMNKLSRVDPCVDLPGIRIDRLSRPYHENRFVTWAMRSAKYEDATSEDYGYGRRSTGFSRGGRIKIRAYDKVWEVRNNPIKRAIIMDRRWGGPVEIASRVEFQLRREALKTFEVDDVNDWEKKKAGIVRYLCGDWFRLTSKKVDRGNTTRTRTAAIWLLVKRRFAEWAGESEPAERITRKVAPQVGPLIKQGLGCMLSAIASSGISPVTLEEIRRTVDKMLFNEAKASEVLDLIRAKKKKLEALKPGFVIANVVDKNGVVVAQVTQ